LIINSEGFLMSSMSISASALARVQIVKEEIERKKEDGRDARLPRYTVHSL